MGDKPEDIIIIGSGPAAYSAALYAKDKSPLCFEGDLIGTNGPGGQLTTTTDVDNYPGFPTGIEGPDLMDIMKQQVFNTGKVRIISETVVGLDLDADTGIFEIKTDEKKYNSKIVIIASGAQARRPNIKGTEDHNYWQKGVSSCAVCDGWRFKQMTVTVIGGGDSAMEEALYLSKLAKRVYLIHRRDDFRARRDMLETVESRQNITIYRSCITLEVKGDGKKVNEIVVKKLKTSDIFKLSTDGVFFAIGHQPNTSFISREKVALDETGYIITDSNCRTNIKGLFACGDVQDKKYRQAITAAASGCTSALSALDYLANFNQ